MIDFDCLHQKRRSVRDMSLQPPKPTILEFLQKLSKYYGIYIYTRRKKENVEKWLTENKMEEFVVDVLTTKNNKATLYLNRENIAILRKIAFETTPEFLFSLDLYYDKSDYKAVISELEKYSNAIY